MSQKTQNIISCVTFILYLIIMLLPVTACSIPIVYLFTTPEFFKTNDSGHLFHIFCSIISVGILGMAGFQSLMLQLQKNAVRTQPNSTLLKLLPPIETMDKLLFQIIILGFVCLSLALLSAFRFASDQYTLSHLHKIVLSFLAWGFFAILIYKHFRAGWRGKTAVRWTLGGIIALLVAYFSSKLILLNIGLNSLD